MPCVQIQFSGTISQTSEEFIQKELGKAIELLPGKTQQWLMLCFHDKCRICFAGTTDSPAAFVKVGVYGTAPEQAYEKLTKAITEVLQQELSVDSTRVYVQYEESRYWGWNGTNF